MRNLKLAEEKSRHGLQKYFLSLGERPGIIVCPDRKFIYMKPPRTAGTSILRNFLEKTIDGIINIKDHKSEFLEWIEHVSDQELEEYYIFTVVRNPWDRFISTAKYLDIPMAKLVEGWSMYQEDSNVAVHTKPLHYFTHNNGKRFVDTICRLETLQPDMSLVCDHLGIDRVILPHVNATKHEHYSRYFKENEIEFVRKIYALDIKYFGYEFEEKRQKHYHGEQSNLISKLRKLLNL